MVLSNYLMQALQGQVVGREYAIAALARAVTLALASRRYSDADLQAMADADAANGGRGRANAVLALPLEAVGEAYQQTPPAERGRLLNVDGHVFHSSVLAVLDHVDAPEYERLDL